MIDLESILFYKILITLTIRMNEDAKKQIDLWLIQLFAPIF